MHFTCEWCIGSHLPGGQSGNTLQLPAVAWPMCTWKYKSDHPTIIGLVSCTEILQKGQLHMRRSQYSFNTSRSHWEPPSTVQYFWDFLTWGLCSETLLWEPVPPTQGLRLAGWLCTLLMFLMVWLLLQSVPVAGLVMIQGDLPGSSNLTTFHLLLSTSLPVKRLHPYLEPSYPVTLPQSCHLSFAAMLE